MLRAKANTVLVKVRTSHVSIYVPPHTVFFCFYETLIYFLTLKLGQAQTTSKNVLICFNAFANISCCIPNKKSSLNKRTTMNVNGCYGITIYSPEYVLNCQLLLQTLVPMCRSRSLCFIFLPYLVFLLFPILPPTSIWIFLWRSTPPTFRPNHFGYKILHTSF